MTSNMRNRHGKHRSLFLISAAFALSYSFYIGQVVALSVDTASNPWPVFPRRNLGSLARAGYLRGINSGDKRSISTLAKNGQLPTFKSPYDEPVKDDNDDDAPNDKRNIASIARLRSYAAMKRNVQSLARDGYRFGRGPQNDKRNIATLARDGLIHKRAEMIGDEYYYPFYQNPVPQMSELDGPLDFNELYDYEQSINPNSLPPLSQVFKRSDTDEPTSVINSRFDYDPYWNLKRGAFGLPAHGLYRPVYIDLNSNTRTKRSIYSIPDVLDRNDIDIPEDFDNDNDDKRSVDNDAARENFQKRHIGSLARLGLLPSFRFSGGRYSRSGRARLLLPSQELYRKHSNDENFGIGEYFVNSEVNAPLDSDDADVSPPTIPSHAHPTGRYLRQPLNNELPNTAFPSRLNYDYTVDKNRWQQSKDVPKFYYFRSLKVPFHSSGKRYLLQPAVDNILLRKTYRNSSLPSRRKNQ